MTSWNRHQAATPHLGVSHTQNQSLTVGLRLVSVSFIWAKGTEITLTFLEPGLESQKSKTSKGRSVTTSTRAEGKPTKVKIHPGAEVTILQKLCWSLQVMTGAGSSSDHLGEPETDLPDYTDLLPFAPILPLFKLDSHVSTPKHRHRGD